MPWIGEVFWNLLINLQLDSEDQVELLSVESSYEAYSNT